MGTHEDDTPEQTAYWEGVAESENELLTLKARIAELEAAVKASSANRALRVARVEDERDAALVRAEELERERDNAQTGWDGCCLHRRDLQARVAELEAEVKAISATWEADTKDADDSRALLADAEAAMEEFAKEHEDQELCWREEAHDPEHAEYHRRWAVRARAVLTRIRERTTPDAEEE